MRAGLGIREWGLGGATLVVALAGALHAQAPPTPASLDEVLARMRAYLTEYVRHLPAVIATEQYHQRAGSGVRALRRQLESDYGFIQVPGDLEWIGFREVLAVDGKPVPDSAHRLAQLFARPSSLAIQQARRIAEESARYNIGPIFRTINDPAFVLELLDARNSHRMRFSKNGETTIDGRPFWIVKFQETGRPTIIRTRDRKDQPAQGRAWIDPVTGTIHRVEATVQPGFGAGNFLGTLDVTFEHDGRLGFAVPAKMLEKYTNRNLVTVSSGEAIYSNYRRFTVDTEENIPLK